MANSELGFFLCQHRWGAQAKKALDDNLAGLRTQNEGLARDARRFEQREELLQQVRPSAAALPVCGLQPSKGGLPAAAQMSTATGLHAASAWWLHCC